MKELDKLLQEIEGLADDFQLTYRQGRYWFRWKREGRQVWVSEKTFEGACNALMEEIENG